jgi:PAS domain S-box-containing protein
LTAARDPGELGRRERRTLRILNLEDDPLDSKLMQNRLLESGIRCELVRVHTRAEFAAALEEGGFDLVLADFSVPSFDGLSALEMAREADLEAPFILVSGTLGEEMAIETIKQGATDYVLKHRLERLVPAVQRAMREAEERRERKRAEEALRSSEERFRTLVEQIPAVTYTQQIVDSSSSQTDHTLYASPQIESQTGYPPRAFVEEPDLWIRLLHPDDRERILAEDEQTDETGEPFKVEYRQYHRDGRIVWIRDEAVLVRDREGRPRFWQGVMLDITEQKRAEEARRYSEELYRSVVEQAAENIFIVDPVTRRILEPNAALTRSLGYTFEELKRMTLYDFIAHDRTSVDENIRRVLEQRRFFIGERKYRRKNGTLVDVEVNVSVVPYGGTEAMCVVAHDVSQRKQAEDELRRSLSVLLALREAGQVLGSTLQSEEIATRLLEIMRGVAGLTAAAISRIDDDGDIHLWHSVGVKKLWPRARFAPEAENARRAVLENETRLSVRLQNPDSADERLVALYLPVKFKDSVLGVLEAYGSEDLAQDNTVEVIGSLTSQAASALENAQLYEKLSNRERELQDLVSKLLGAQEEERRRVAYEVHDGLAQVAVAAHQHLQAFARRYAPEAESGRRDLERILRLVRGTVSDARRIIANLRPTTLDDLGLAATLSLEVERLREEGYRIDYEENLGEGRLPVTAEITLFRVAQEALTNMRKHAKAESVRIELRHEGPEVHLEIRDYGRGFEPGTASLVSGPGERVGLAGMRERVGMIGGTLEVRSSPGAGTSVTASVPLGTWRSP